MCNLLEIFATCWCGRKITVSIKVKLYTGCACDLSLDRHANLETGAAIRCRLELGCTRMSMGPWPLSAPLAGHRTARKLQNFSQKVKKSKSFRLFDFFDFSSRNLLECDLFDFSQKVKRSKSFRLFEFFNFFRFFRLFEQKSPGM